MSVADLKAAIARAERDIDVQIAEISAYVTQNKELIQSTTQFFAESSDPGGKTINYLMGEALEKLSNSSKRLQLAKEKLHAYRVRL